MSHDTGELTALLSPMVALAVQNAALARRLEEERAASDARERELAELTAELLHAHEEERRRLALDLHDDPLQRAILLAREFGSVPDDRAQRWRLNVEEIITSLHSICSNLRPRALEDFGLIGALQWLLNDLRARCDLDLDLIIRVAEGARAEDLDLDLATALYRITQEALNNCAKHARASWADVILIREADRIALAIVDDGQQGAHEGSARESLHLGMLGMRERLRPWGGTVQVASLPYGGMLVTVQVRLGNEHGRGAGTRRPPHPGGHRRRSPFAASRHEALPGGER